jgi:hypothetical protein
LSTSHTYTRPDGSLVSVEFQPWTASTVVTWVRDKRVETFFVGPVALSHSNRVTEDDVWSIIHELYEQVPDLMEIAFEKPIRRHQATVRNMVDEYQRTVDQIETLLTTYHARR